MKHVDRFKKWVYNYHMVEKNGDVPAISKMNQIFDLLAVEHRSIGQAEICSKLNLPKATVSRLINTLTGMGYIEQDKKSGLYSLGAKLLTLGSIVNKRLDLTNIAKPIIQQLSEDTGEMVKISIMRGDIIYPLTKQESKKSMRITLDTGTVFPPYNGAAGKLLMAFTEDGLNYLEHRLPQIEMKAFTKYTITDIEQLKEHLVAIRERGYACDNQEESLGIYAIAAPVYDAEGVVIAAVSIPFFGDYREKKDLYLPKLLNCAKEISQSMGYQI